MRTIPRLSRIRGTVDVPPSRHETLRSLLRAAVAPHPVTVAGGLDMDDTRYVLEAIRTLGFEVSGSFGSGIVIADRVSIYATEVEIDVADAEAAFRWLLPFFCFTPGRTILRSGTPLSIAAVVESLREFGAEIEYPYGEGEPPLQVRGKVVRGGSNLVSDDQTTMAAMKVMSQTFRDGLSINGERVQPDPAGEQIEVTSDPFLTACWRGAVEAIGGELVLNGERIESAGGNVPRPAPADEMQRAAWEAIGGLASGGVTVAADAALARAYPRFWKIFDQIVAASS
jgi:5-enolpyruvylshikimate-3-phosphate synthase